MAPVTRPRWFWPLAAFLAGLTGVVIGALVDVVIWQVAR